MRISTLSVALMSENCQKLKRLSNVKMPKLVYFLQFFVIVLGIHGVHSKSEQGKADFILSPLIPSNDEQKTLFAGSKIYVQITCDSKSPDAEIKISWTLTERMCWEETVNFETKSKHNDTIQMKFDGVVTKCLADGHIILPEVRFGEAPQIVDKNPNESANGNGKKPAQTQAGTTNMDHPVFTITKDGIYDFSLKIEPINEINFRAPVHIEMKQPHGYLSAIEWPLLPFYGVMCLVYVIFGIIWLIVSFLQWRDLLRIQFWIGGVILLGMLEKAVFYAEYQSINTTGNSVRGAELAAEWVSCAKRTLARMLVIIMSLGFGIVKPRLGPMLHRVVGTGALYFILACVESYLRVMRKKSDQNNELLVASIPLAVLDSGICWWIFTSLVQTTRTLRLRRNMVKLSLYRHFTNLLIFSVIASVVFMLYSIKAHKTSSCSPGWREVWVDIAFWHVLFSVLLLVIMILWRPTNNNQRYAFTPLLDNPEDEDDDEEEQFVADAYGVKMRGTHTNSTRPLTPKATTTEEDDLRWVEENIPSAIAEPALPVLDSDEEIINTKFEVSKMQ